MYNDSSSSLCGISTLTLYVDTSFQWFLNLIFLFIYFKLISVVYNDRFLVWFTKKIREKKKVGAK